MGKEHAAGCKQELRTYDDETCGQSSCGADALTGGTQREDQDQRKDVCWCVVVASSSLGAARRTLRFLLSTEQLRTQHMRGDMAPRKA